MHQAGLSLSLFQHYQEFLVNQNPNTGLGLAPSEEVPQQQGQVHAEIHTHPGGSQQTVESTTRNPGRCSMLADEVSQYLEDVNELDNAIIKPTPNLPTCQDLQKDKEQRIC